MGSDESRVSACHKSLSDVTDAEGNSVWTWCITNVLGPDRLARRKVNRIAANPPWVKLSNIQVVERKRALERAGKDSQPGSLDLWAGGRQAPHFDIAQLFIRHARGSFLKEPETDPSAWVTKASAIRAGNWKKFRDWHAKLLAQTLDLSDAKAFGGGDARRSCVLFEVRPSALHAGSSVKAVCPAAMPEASMPWAGRGVESLLRWQAPDEFP